MSFVSRPPAPALAPFVESLWHVEGGSFDHQHERILPTGNLQLLVNLDEDELRSWHDGRLQRIGGAALCGSFDRPFIIDTAEQRFVVGVSFRPGGAFPFFTAPADAVRGLHVELSDLWGDHGRVVRERLLEQPSARARLDLLERLLMSFAVRPLAPEPAMRFALEALDRGAAVASVTARLGVTPRRFIRRFSEVVGLSPKRWQRVRRFQRVLTSVGSGGGSDWAGVALACGYFDQAHLIHDFQAFSGISPARYRPSDAGRNHVPVR